MTAFDADLVRRWLAVLHGDSQGLIHICASGLWTGATFAVGDLDAAVEYVRTLDATAPEGIYVRVTSLRGALEPGSRGGADDSMVLPALWADLDIAGPGHKTDLTLPPDEAAARAVIATSGLPVPTLWISSGGGLYPIWLLDRPHLITDDLSEVADLTAGWQKVIAHAAGGLGWHYGTGVGDLARVLRIPGTINRKAGQERACRIVSASPRRYTLAECFEAMATAVSAIPEPEVPRLATVRSSDGSVSPGDDYAERVDWADILTPHGWTYAYTRGQTRYWRRPGKEGAGISATTNARGTDMLKVFSTDAGLPTEGTLSKLYVNAALNHGGDLKAAAKTLKDDGYGRAAPISPDPVAAQKAALTELLPGQSARVLTAVDGTAARIIAEPAPQPHAYGPTEDGLARALVAHHGHRMRYCPQRGRWLGWDGHRWAWDESEIHRELIRGLARNLPDDEKGGWGTFKKRALSASGVTGVARLAQSDPAVLVHVRQLDANPWELNTPAGIVDLRTGGTRAPDPAAMHTRSTFCAPDTAEDPTAWLLFLSQTFGSDALLVDYLRRLVGYSAVGLVGAHVLPFAYGSGGNGKGVFLEAIAGVLGEYATTAPVGFLMAQMHANHETEIARLAGTRMVLCSEVNEGDRFDEAKVKQLTGGDTLTARFMRQDHFSFVPSHQLWLMGNHKPKVRSGGRAFWRRVRLLPFLHEVAEENVIDDLQGILVREHGPALLAWIVAGAVEYHSSGLGEPDSVKSATAEWARDINTVKRFVEECCHLGGGENAKSSISKVYEEYEKWCSSEGDDPVTKKTFGMTMKNAFGVEATRTMHARFYLGLTLLSRDEDPENVSSESGNASSDGGRYR